MHRMSSNPPKEFTATVKLLKSTHLRDRCISPFHPSKPPDIITLTTKNTVEEALQSLASFNILSAPVIDAITKDYIGIIDVISILGSFLHKIYPELLSEDYVITHKRHSMNELQTLGAEFANSHIALMCHGGDMWFKGDAGSTLMEVVESGFRVTLPSEKIHHRVAIFDILPGESTQGGPFPEWRIVDVLSQTDVLRLLASHMHDLEHCDAGMTTSIEDLGLVSRDKSVMMVHASTPTIIALSLMYKSRLSAIAITTDSIAGIEKTAARDVAHGMGSSSKKSLTKTSKARVAGNLSASDIRGIRTKHFGALALPVGAFLVMMHLQGDRSSDSIYEDALVGDLPEAMKQGDWDRAMTELQPLVSCTTDATLKDVISVLVDTGKHRVYVKEKDGESVVGVITPTDVLREMVLYNNR